MTPARALARTAAVAALMTTSLAVPFGPAAAEATDPARADVRGNCVVAPEEHDLTTYGEAASFNHPRHEEDLSAFSDPTGQVAKAYGKARWETPETVRPPYGDGCTVDAEFTNVLTVGAGTTGLAIGTPVTLIARARLGATADEEANFHEEYSTTWRMVASYAVSGPAPSCTTEPCAPTTLAEYWTTADRDVYSDSGWSGDPDGYIAADGDYSWYLKSNAAPRQEGGASLDEDVCQSIPCTVGGTADAPARVLDPWTHPLGTRTIAFTTRVGDQLTLRGDLATFTQAYDITISAFVDATDGLHAAVLPGDGFEGLDLQLGDGQGEPVDLDAPTVGIVPDQLPGDSGWYSADVPLSVSASDGEGSGVTSITTVVGDGEPVVTPGSTASVLVTAEGETTVYAWAADAAGNVSEIATRVVRLDRTSPQLTVPSELTVQRGIVTYTVTAADALDPAPVTVCTPASGSDFPLGRTTVHCTATDHAGNGASASFDVVAYATPEQVLADLRTVLAGLDLPEGEASRFTGSLGQVERALADGGDACAPLERFVDMVERSRLDAAEQEALLDLAGDLGQLLGC